MLTQVVHAVSSESQASPSQSLAPKQLVNVLSSLAARHQRSGLGRAAIVPDVGAVGQAGGARRIDPFEYSAGALADRLARTPRRAATGATRSLRAAVAAPRDRKHRTQQEGP